MAQAVEGVVRRQTRLGALGRKPSVEVARNPASDDSREDEACLERRAYSGRGRRAAVAVG